MTAAVDTALSETIASPLANSYAPRSVRRRKVRAAKLIADGLWVDWRQGEV